MVTLTLRFLHINKRYVPIIIMSIFTYFSISITILSFTNASALLSAAEHQPLRGKTTILFYFNTFFYLFLFSYTFHLFSFSIFDFKNVRSFRTTFKVFWNYFLQRTCCEEQHSMAQMSLYITLKLIWLFDILSISIEVENSNFRRHQNVNKFFFCIIFSS
jgi:hypothetical protein